jgi:hypothetical protein
MPTDVLPYAWADEMNRVHNDSFARAAKPLGRDDYQEALRRSGRQGYQPGRPRDDRGHARKDGTQGTQSDVMPPRRC